MESEILGCRPLSWVVDHSLGLGQIRVIFHSNLKKIIIIINLDYVCMDIVGTENVGNTIVSVRTQSFLPLSKVIPWPSALKQMVRCSNRHPNVSTRSQKIKQSQMVLVPTPLMSSSQSSPLILRFWSQCSGETGKMRNRRWRTLYLTVSMSVPGKGNAGRRVTGEGGVSVKNNCNKRERIKI